MKIEEFARGIVFGESISDKITFSDKAPIDFCDELNHQIFDIPHRPARCRKIQFNNAQFKFPRKSSLHLNEKRAMAIHFFANHELMAIEMMAAAILKYPTNNEKMLNFKKGLVQTIRDEQKHLGLYITRMNELGIEFGDFPLNDFFWKHMPALETAEMFYAVVALTFEQANLDFAKYYQLIFKDVGDFATENIMQTIYEDEIIHVARGHQWFKKWHDYDSFWNYYRSALPENIVPARGKGMSFDHEGRKKAGLDMDFIKRMDEYRDPFKVVNRKS